MRRPRPFLASVLIPSLLTASLFLVSAAPADAQAADSFGIRAQGMGGAFTAVADDASASWWNPAGLAGGAYLNALVEYDRPRDADADRRAFAFAFPALGLSYYRLPVSEMRPLAGATAASAAGRQDQGTGVVRSLEVSQFGVSVGQSVGQHLVVASTLKLLRASGETEGGLDVGAIAALGLVRLGVMVRNLREATFGSGDAAQTLRRHVRAGAAVTTTQRSVVGGVTLAFDADLMALPGALGDERRIGVGAEIWTPRRSFGARAGYSASTLGDRRSAPTAGLSLALHPGVYVDGQVTGGSDSTRHGWGADLRVTF